MVTYPRLLSIYSQVTGNLPSVLSAYSQVTMVTDPQLIINLFPGNYGNLPQLIIQSIPR